MERRSRAEAPDHVTREPRGLPQGLRKQYLQKGKGEGRLRLVEIFLVSFRHLGCSFSTEPPTRPRARDARPSRERCTASRGPRAKEVQKRHWRAVRAVGGVRGVGGVGGVGAVGPGWRGGRGGRGGRVGRGGRGAKYKQRIRPTRPAPYKTRSYCVFSA